MVKFEPKRININNLDDLKVIDKVGLRYGVNVTHYPCLTKNAVCNMVVLGPPNSSQSTALCREVFFHPNICEDGWTAFQKRWKIMLEEGFGNYPCPDAPRLWTESVTGSDTIRWPPIIFKQWAEMVNEGQTMSLDAGLPVAGSSRLGQQTSSVLTLPSSSRLPSLHPSPSPSPSPPKMPTSHPLPSAPPPPTNRPTAHLPSPPSLSPANAPTACVLSLPLPPPPPPLAPAAGPHDSLTTDDDADMSLWKQMEDLPWEHMEN
jgi:hypothetical protein